MISNSKMLLFHISVGMILSSQPVWGNPAAQSDCSRSDVMTGKFMVGENGFFEREVCGDVFSLSLRLLRREDQILFGEKWIEADRSETFEIRMRVEGFLTGETNSLGRPIYEVTGVTYLD